MSTLEHDRKPTEILVEELLARWEESCERGEKIDASTLCCSHPELAAELARRIQVLVDWDRFSGTTCDTEGGPRPSMEALLKSPESAVISLNLADLRFHARGGLGAIYSARDDRLGREMAVKFASVPDGTYSEAEINRRFLREVRVTAALEHPGIVPVHGLGQDGRGHLCYAMRLITGKTLGKAVQEFHTNRRSQPSKRRPNLRQDANFRSLVQRLRSACVTVAYAHSRGYLHRDLKPDHILLGDFDLTLVVDWGLTKSFTDMEATPWHPGLGVPQCSELSTETGIGTLGFASPEQQAGDWPRVGPASDVYSLGAILYVLLTNDVPFSGQSAAEVVRLVESGELVAPRKRNPEVPCPLEAICLKALATLPEDRYPSAQAMADDLERWLSDSPVIAYREPWATRTRRVIDHHSLALFLFLAAFGGGLVAVTASWHRGRLRSMELDSLAYATADRAAREQIYEKQPGWATEGLNQVGRASAISTSIRSAPALRSLAVSCLGGIDLRPVGELSTMPVGCLSFSPEGRRLAAGELFGSTNCRVQVIDLETRRPLWEQAIPSEGPTDGTPGVSAIRFSPDGRWLAAGLRDGRLLLWDATRERPIPRKIFRHKLRVVGLGFTPDGNSLASASQDGQLTLAELRSQAGWEVIRSVQLVDRISDMAISQDGRVVVCVGPNGVITQELSPLREPDLSIQTQKGKGHSTDRVAISPDGLSLALPSNWFHTLAIGNEPSPDGMVDTDLGVAHQEETSRVEFSPDGSLIVTGSADNTVKIWDVASRRMVLRQPVFSESLVIPVFDSEGHRLAIGSSEGVWLHDLLGNETCRTRAIGSGIVTEFAFLSSGRPLDPPDMVALRAGLERSPVSLESLEVWAGPGLRPARLLPLEAPVVRTEGTSALESSPVDRRLSLNLRAGPRLLDLASTQSQSNPLKLEVPVVASFSPDNQFVWTLTRNGTVTSWKLDDFTERTRWDYRPFVETRGRVGITCLAAGHEMVIAGTLAGRVLFGKADTGWLDHMTRASGPVQAVALSPDESLIACGTRRGGLDLLRVKDSMLLTHRDAHAESIEQLRFHPSGRYLATLSRDRNLVLWQVGTSSLDEIFRITSPFRRAPSMIRFSPDGRYLGILIPGERAVRLWDFERLHRALSELGLDWD
jgi:serine/threonine protein kinase